MTNPVFVADPGCAIAEIPVGSTVVVTGAEAKHATVMRLRPGDELDLVDGRGNRVPCRVESTHPQQLTAVTVGCSRSDVLRPRLVVVQALAKGGADEQAITSATEVGAHTVIPWQSDRAIVRWAGPKAAKGHAKWQSTVRVAAKQSRRAWIPQVDPVVSTSQLATRVQEATGAGTQVWLLHESDQHRFVTHLDRLDHADEVWVIVGPEGGIAPAEYETLVSAGAQPVRLGPTVLRSATAATVALSVITCQAGWWS